MNEYWMVAFNGGNGFTAFVSFDGCTNSKNMEMVVESTLRCSNTGDSAYIWNADWIGSRT